MHEGFIVDRFDHAHRLVSMWVEGAPERTFWTGLRLKGRKTIEVQCLVEVIAATAQFGPTEVVGEDEDDVGLFGVSSGENGTERSKGSKEQKAEEHWNGPWVGRLVGCVAT